MKNAKCLALLIPLCLFLGCTEDKDCSPRQVIVQHLGIQRADESNVPFTRKDSQPIFLGSAKDRRWRWPVAIYALPKGNYTIHQGRHFTYSCHK